MNPLEEHPHLFANGKFKLYHTDGIWVFTGDDAETIRRAPEKDNWPKWTQEVKLIARPIEDISYKEMQQLLSYAGLSIDNYNARKSDLIAWAKQDTLCFQDARKILSIGVYPFDQSHFEDGTVINATNLKQTA